MLKLGMTIAQLGTKIGKLPLSKLKKAFKEYYGKDDAGLSKDQLKTKLASAAQKSVKQKNRAVRDKAIIGTLGLTEILRQSVSKTDDATLKASDVRKKPASEATKKKKPSIPTEKPTPRLKKKKEGVTFEFETIPKGKQKAKLSTGGAAGLKKIRADQPGLKALKKKAPQVVRNMGYLRKGSLVTKKKTKGGNKGGKGILVVSIGVGKMAKKKPTTKKKTTKKTKRG